MATRKTSVTTGKTPVSQNKKIARKRTAAKKSTAKKASVKTITSNPVSTPIIKLEPVSVINNAESIYQELERINADTDVNIDASEVEMIDTAIFQLLYAFVIKIQSSSHSVNWIKPSEEFIGRAKLLGLSSHMDIH